MFSGILMSWAHARDFSVRVNFNMHLDRLAADRAVFDVVLAASGYVDRGFDRFTAVGAMDWSGFKHDDVLLFSGVGNFIFRNGRERRKEKRAKFADWRFTP